jgi:hypothetical protein
VGAFAVCGGQLQFFKCLTAKFAYMTSKFL